MTKTFLDIYGAFKWTSKQIDILRDQTRAMQHRLSQHPTPEELNTIEAAIREAEQMRVIYAKQYREYTVDMLRELARIEEGEV